ncbi:MAG TPA: PIN domain-containing protein [Burkholderiaceae bacterium]|jgi:tRNA(fMet)-specific endonuclease VapC
MALYLLDTNIISALMQTPEGPAMTRVVSLLQASSPARIGLSVVVQCELRFGLRRKSHPRWQRRYEETLELMELFPLDSAIAEPYAELRRTLESAGTPIGANDTLIAAHALALDATLVSADAEFACVPGLRLENWLI